LRNFVVKQQRRLWGNIMAKTKELTIKLVKSPHGRIPSQAKTLKALGLTKINQVVKKPDNDAIRGMIETCKHLLEVTE